MTKGTGEGAAAAKNFASQWRELRADGDIQFAPVARPAPDKPPQWWVDFVEWLNSIAGTVGIPGEAILWTLIGIGVLLIGFILWRYLESVSLTRRVAGEAGPEWTPDQGEALALLEDADRLAAEGRYDEATHLLLRRSVGQIAAARPGLLEPSSTAREIAALPALSDNVRGAFGTIAGRVERSLFALRSLTADDWRAARAAYADFALAAPQIAA